MSRGEQFKSDEIIKALKETKGMVYLAAERLGCNRKTIERRAETVAAVKDVIDNYRGRRIDIAELKLENALTNGEPWAIQFTLKTIGKSRGYVERQEVTGANGGKLQIEYVNDWRGDE